MQGKTNAKANNELDETDFGKTPSWIFAQAKIPQVVSGYTIR